MNSKMWYIYTINYYYAIQQNKIMSFAGKWMELEVIMLSEISQAHQDKYCIFFSHAKISIFKKRHESKGKTIWAKEGQQQEGGWGTRRSNEKVNMIKAHYMHAQMWHNQAYYCV
jgi:hypothetical protein